jgi:hypothetical protein
VRARLATENGTRGWLRAYWGERAHGSEYGYHDGRLLLGDSDRIDDLDRWGKVADYAVERFPAMCETCAQPRPADAKLQVFTKRRYDTPTGLLEPGCLFWAPWYHDRGEFKGCIFWDSDVCGDSRGHLMAMLPNGHEWDIDSRASNCTMKDDRRHKCWCRHGEPPDVHVDKSGVTCAAGAGSIAVPGWHGFLHSGEFVG